MAEAKGPRVESTGDELWEMFMLDQCSENPASDDNNETPSAFGSQLIFKYMSFW